MTVLPLLLAAACLAYFNALAAGFQFDDFNVIVDNPAVHSLAAWWAGMPGIRPLLKLSYALNWLADPGPGGFHAVNILLHLVNVALVWRLTGHLPAASAERRLATRVVATLLFAVHPIQTESVTYVSGRSMVLMASFGLAGLLAWLEAPGRARPGPWRLAAGLLLVAAVLTKEVAVILPLTLLLFRQPEGKARWLPLVLAGLALAALFGVFGYRHLFAEPAPRTLAANLLSEANAVYYLLGQLFRPWALNIDPELPELTGWSTLSAIQATGIAAALAAAWRFRHNRPWLTFAVAWFVILLLPTHSLIPRLDLASERHLYLAGLGPFWLAAVALAALPGRLAWTALAALAVAGIAFTHLRNQDYRDEIGLWRQTAALSPGNARAWNNLGWAYHLAGRRDEARQAFQRALTIEPDDELARSNLDYLNRMPP